MTVDPNTGKTVRNDTGKHRIIFPAKLVRKKPGGRNRMRRKVGSVKFEGISQQICKDFGVKYLWYDQLCIPQDDIKAKQHEILQMHQIYSNAHCTVVLVPEFHTRAIRSTIHILSAVKTRYIRRATYTNNPYQVQWLRRLWTLEEALLSHRLLFIGRDVHSWWYEQRRITHSPFHLLCQCSLHTHASWWNACNTLYYAHERTSSQDYDRVFALASLFPDIINTISIDYEQSLPELMVQFYGILAKKDPSILCFGKLRRSSEVEKYSFLPSWTGAAGSHCIEHSYKNPNNNDVVVVDVHGKLMYVTCTSMTSSKDPTVIGGENPSTWTFDDIPPIPEGPKHLDGYCSLAIYTKFPGHHSGKEKR